MDRESRFGTTYLLPAFAAFLTYFCMYCFRKPFTAASYEGMFLLGFQYKSILVVVQVLGYMCAKFWGIRFISELGRKNRSLIILALIGISEIALLGFAILPTNLKPLCLFVNGFPLGLIWGLVFSFLEGRKNTEFLGSFMAVSFIISSGVSKNIGKILMLDYGVDMFWMPFYIGLFVFPVLLFSCWLLTKIPDPSDADVASRHVRTSMNSDDRKNLFYRFAIGISLFVLIYMMLNAFRDFRDNFIVELWAGLGFASNSSLLTTAEIPIMIFVLSITSLTAFIKNNYQAFFVDQLLIAISAFIIFGSTFLFQLQYLSPLLWMIAVGCGLYLAYIIFQCIIFERFIAAFKINGNIGFLMYIADAFGYLASIGILIYKEFFFKAIQWVDFFIGCCYLISAFMLVLISAAMFYFSRKYRKFKLIPINHE
ncbi:MAG: DUF5690 family protein [Saprospiraceae bacterium]